MYVYICMFICVYIHIYTRIYLFWAICQILKKSYSILKGGGMLSLHDFKRLKKIILKEKVTLTKALKLSCL